MKGEGQNRPIKGRGFRPNGEYEEKFRIAFPKLIKTQNQDPYMTRNESAILLIIRQFRQAGYDYIRKRGLRKTAGNRAGLRNPLDFILILLIIYL